MTALNDRWLSGRHLGDAKPTLQAFIRNGHFRRDYFALEAGELPVDAQIYGETKAKPWRAKWTPSEAFMILPNVVSCELTQDYDNNGITVATIVLDNVIYQNRTGVGGEPYTTMERGYLSPWRGTGIIFGGPIHEQNSWFTRLARNAQIKLFQGYGDATMPTFTGLIDDCDMTSRPDTITITARDFGQALIDQDAMGWSKSKQLPEPIVFRAQGKWQSGAGDAVGHGATASSTRAGYFPRFVTDSDVNTVWYSDTHPSAAATEWVQIRLPRGRYEAFAIHNEYPGMEVFVGIYADDGGGASCRVNSSNVGNGWITPSELTDAALGGASVPGANGGWPYVKHFATMSDQGHTNELGHVFDLGDDSILRIGYRNLHRTGQGFRAGTARLKAIRLESSIGVTTPDRERVIRVDDVTDIVKVVLRWAGFSEWTVEPAGVGMKGTLSFARTDKLMDIIAKVRDAVGFVFYMAEPSGEDLSIGVPTFVSNRAIANLAFLPELHDSETLTGIQTKASDELLATDIRVRGKPSKEYGITLGFGGPQVLEGHYKPPWGIRSQRMAGLIKHVVHLEPKAKHTIDCLLLAQLIALQQALGSATAQAEVRGNPEIALNSQVILYDRGTGLNTRLYVASRSSSFAAGANASYTTSLGGALIDTPDVYGVITDIRTTLESQGKDPNVINIGDPFDEKTK